MITASIMSQHDLRKSKTSWISTEVVGNSITLRLRGSWRAERGGAPAARHPEIAFERNVECEPALGILPTRKIGQSVARSSPANLDQPSVHHDALESPDGQVGAADALV